MLRSTHVAIGILGVLVSGCIGWRGPADFASVSPDDGVRARYAAPLDAVVGALPAALRSHGLALVDDAPVDSSSSVIGRRTVFLSNAHFVRLRVDSLDAGETEVHAAHLERVPGGLFVTGDRSAVRVIQSLDSLLGPRRIAPFPGMVVRGIGPDGEPVRGHLSLNEAGGFTVDEAGIALSSLTATEVMRGDYGHTSEGRIVGLVLGGVIAGLVASTRDNGSFDEAVSGGVDAITVSFLGGLVGALLGGEVGRAARTEVWSPLPGG